MRLRSSASSHLFYSFSARMARGSRRFCALYAAPSRLTTITSQQRRSFSKENLCSHQRFCQGTASAVPYSSRPRAALAAEVRSPVRSAGSQFQYNRSIAHFFLSPPSALRTHICSSPTCPHEGRATCHPSVVLQQCPRSIREFQTRIAQQTPRFIRGSSRGAHKKDSHK